MPHTTVPHPTNPELITVWVKCVECKKPNGFHTNGAAFIAGWAARNNGALTQDALPHLTPDQRELLISNICQRCFDAAFD